MSNLVLDVDDGNGEKMPGLQIPLYERPIIEVRNVHKTYLLGLEGVTALRGITNEYYRCLIHCLAERIYNNFRNIRLW
jgi:hypothetical protein